MEKLYDRIDWNNNTSPALNETNLNLMSKAIDDIDDRVVAIGGDVLEVIPQIQAYLEQADDLVEALELMTANPPYIGENGHWYVWDTETGAYVDSDIDASITVEIADITMLAPDATPYVTNSGTDTDPVFHLFIPRGQAGAPGQDGVSPTVTITTITGGHRVTITDADHTSGQSFDVMDGQDGGVTSFNGRTGTVTPQSGDYTASDVGAVASNGGEAGDTIVTFTDPSQDGNITSGSALKTIIGLIKYKLSHITGGGHTILNSSGTAMNQRGKLQFDGATVTDDQANDKTIVTTTPQSMVGDAWILDHDYAVGDYSIDANGLYKNGTAHTSTATNRPSINQNGYWTLVSVASELKVIGSKLSDVYFLYKNGSEPYGAFALATNTDGNTHGESLSKGSNVMTFSTSFVQGAHYGFGFLRIALPNEVKTCTTFAVRISSFSRSTTSAPNAFLVNTNTDTVSAVSDSPLSSVIITATGTYIMQSSGVGNYFGVGFSGGSGNGSISVQIAEIIAIR